MKKKINYYNIPDNLLNFVVGESYPHGDYTLKDELDKYGEDILFARWDLTSYELGGVQVKWFHAWTKTYSMVLIDSEFGDKMVLGLLREIPEEIHERTKKKRTRTVSTNSKTSGRKRRT